MVPHIFATEMVTLTNSNVPKSHLWVCTAGADNLLPGLFLVKLPVACLAAKEQR